MDPGLKKRLIGAAVLIALAVIFVPMLLPSRSDTGPQSVSLTVPPQPGAEMQTRVLAVGPDSASAGTSAVASINDPDRVARLDLAGRPPPAPGSTAAAGTVVAPPQSSIAAGPGAPAAANSAPAVAAETPAASTTSATTKPAAPPPVAGGPGAAAGTVYTVNMGIYSNQAGAERLVANAKQHGFTAVATPETWQGKPVLRVRAGPFASRAQAEAARLKLKGFTDISMTIDSDVVNQAGDAPATALPAGQAGAWAVQLAAYSTEAQANALRDRLRAQGFDGYVDEADASGNRLWRVRAGPFASREVATAKRDEIAGRLKITGDVVTQK